MFMSPPHQRSYKRGFRRSYTLFKNQQSTGQKLQLSYASFFWTLIGLLNLFLLCLGWYLTYPLFWNWGWYYLAFIPWLFTFLVLACIEGIVLTHFGLSQLDITYQDTAPKDSSASVPDPIPAYNYEEGYHSQDAPIPSYSGPTEQQM